MFRRHRGSTRAGTILLAAGAIAALTAAGARPASAHVTAGALSAARDSSEPSFSGTLTSSVTAQLKITSAPQGCTPPDELSGPSWVSRFPGSDLVSDLSGSFRQHVTDFISAMQLAGITVTVINTLRRPEQAYLMHYSWLIAKGQIDPAAVPPFAPGPGRGPVSICWQHTDPSGAEDLAASAVAAKGMVRGYHISPGLAVAPALDSLHTEGLAIDMTTTWSNARITIVDGTGHPVTISTTSHNGLNSGLIAVGATYGVIHYLNAAADPTHWSANGH
jgi:hypothetical protein